MNSSDRIFLKFAKVVSKHAEYSSIIIKSGAISSFFNYNHLKVQLGVFLTGYTVTMVTDYVEKTTINCSLI